MRLVQILSVLVATILLASASFALDPEPYCQKGRAKAAGKYAKCIANEVAKYYSGTGDLAKLGKCVTKYGGTWAKLQSRASGSGSMCDNDRYDATSAPGMVIDLLTGLQWEQKTGPCPAGYSASGNYSTTVPLATTGEFTSVVDSSGTTWTGTATNDILGSTSDCGGTVTGSTYSGTCYFGTVPISGMIDCGLQTVSMTLGGGYVGSGSGVITNPHDLDNVYTWSATPPAADGTAFTSFLAALNGGGFAGQYDWRLPTFAELLSIIQPAYPDCTSAPCLDAIFGPTVSNRYWTSSSYGYPPENAWTVGFDGGFVGTFGKANGFYVRAVRGGS